MKLFHLFGFTVFVFGSSSKDNDSTVDNNLCFKFWNFSMKLFHIFGFTLFLACQPSFVPVNFF